MTTMDYTNRPRTVRLALHATASRPPGRGRRWTVEAGDGLLPPRWRGEGATERDAADALAAGLQAWLAIYRPPLTLSFGGYHAVVWVEPGFGENPLCWGERVVGPAGHRSESYGSHASWDEAEASARYHLAQLVTDPHNDASVHRGAAYLTSGVSRRGGYGHYGRDELHRHASWQRAARAAQAEGRDNWHEWATNNWRQFPIPQPAQEADRA